MEGRRRTSGFGHTGLRRLDSCHGLDVETAVVWEGAINSVFRASFVWTSRRSVDCAEVTLLDAPMCAVVVNSGLHLVTSPVTAC